MKRATSWDLGMNLMYSSISRIEEEDLFVSCLFDLDFESLDVHAR